MAYTQVGSYILDYAEIIQAYLAVASFTNRKRLIMLTLGEDGLRQVGQHRR
jgi:hypothetical protein